MKQAVNIVGLAFTLIFTIVIFYYAEEVSDARLDSLFSSMSSYSSYSSPYSYYSSFESNLDDDLTEEAGWISLIFISYFVFQFIFNLIKVRTKTNKIISIIGISLSGIWLIWDFLMISSPGALSFDEIAPGFLFYTMTVIAFSIIGLVHVGVYNRKYAASAPVNTNHPHDVLDV
ncbi:MAG: hypothetical protein K0R65_382 [Crocinitomicaceae bacterium]|jgi:hypothetical protein|nr:hypothetical protein [Crocinitomicaceae bacterium]